MMFGFVAETSMSSMRPPMLAGPMLRNRNGTSSGSLDALITGRLGAPVGGACAPATAGARQSPRKRTALVVIRLVPLIMTKASWLECGREWIHSGVTKRGVLIAPYLP